jgi:hypothetical protein
MVRGGYRLVPTMIRKPFYRAVVAQYGARRNRSRDRAAGGTPPGALSYIPRHARRPDQTPAPLPTPPEPPQAPPVR